MAKTPKKSTDLPVRVDVGARAEAKLEIKTEVPAQSSGRLVDALTDLIRPFSEARGLRADQIRLQREEVAIEIARRARRRIEVEEGQASPVSTKILVPLIEKGSYEELEDVDMVERWANLLAFASMKANVQPRFVGILGELGRSQAECLEHVAFDDFAEWKYPYKEFSDAPYDLKQYAASEDIEIEFISKIEDESDVDVVCNDLAGYLRRPGVYLELIFVHFDNDGEMYAPYDVVERTNIRRDADLSILESLGVIRRVGLSFDHRINGKSYCYKSALFAHNGTRGCFLQCVLPSARHGFEGSG